MAKSLDYKLSNMVNVRGSDVAVRFRKSLKTIDLQTIVDYQQLIVFFRDNIDRVPIRGLVDLKTISKELLRAENFESFLKILNDYNANIFSQYKLNQMAKNFGPEVINNSIEFIYEWDHKLKKTLNRMSQIAKNNYRERGVWTLYASYGFLKGATFQKSLIKAPLINIAIDFEFDGAKMYLVKKDKTQVLNERLYVFLMREYGNNFPINEFDIKNNLIDIAKDIEKIIKQPILTDKVSQILEKYKEESKDEFDDSPVLEIIPWTTVSILELTGGKLKQDLSRILELNEPDAFEGNDNQKTTEYFQNEIINGTKKLVQIHRPINLYQKFAINSALNQNTIIIGAPGTGKSEVIANLIANIIVNKKNGMLVSEKEAALDVIVNRVGKINNLILYMHDFKSKDNFYKSLLDMEELLGQWYRKDFSDYYQDLIGDKIINFNQAYDHFYRLSKNEIDLSKKRDPYNEDFIEYINSQFTTSEVILRLGISSYLLLPDNSSNYELWNSLSFFLSRNSTTNINAQFRKWYESNHYLFDEPNFDFFLRNTWNEYISFKFLCSENKQLLQQFPQLIKILLKLNSSSDRAYIGKWLSYDQKRFILIMYWMLENGVIKKKVSRFKMNQLNHEYRNLYKKHYGTLRNFLKQFNQIQKLNWTSFNKLEEFDLTTSDWKKVIQENWWISLFTNNPLLDILRRYSFQEAIYNMKRNELIFTKDNDELITINYLNYLRSKLNSLSKKEMNLFLEMFKQASKNPRPSVIYFIRKYYKQLREIFPIWVLSPDNVAELIPLSKGEFNYGIFDEASQMFLERGYPLVYRCENNTIAGDLNQLKPTSFFMSRYDDSVGDLKNDEMDFDNYDEEMENLETDENEAIVSLLEKAEVSRWNKFHLKNHYRSITKQLIEFSNKNIYDNLLNIATVNGAWLDNKSIEIINAHGIWDKQSNQKEAETVVKKIIELHNKYESILVVAFNLKQAELIEDILLNDDKVDTEIKQKINKSIFISNLENVQGTEADLVILSVAFAPGLDGAFRANFGVLNRDGGRNRLNVAITRARLKMIVIKSFSARDIGTRLLGSETMFFINYIRYLDTLEQTQSSEMLIFEKNTIQEFENPFVKTVYNSLININFGDNIYIKTKLPVGNKVIDIGIMDVLTNKCVLGIIIDYWTTSMSVKSKMEEYDWQLFLENRGFKMFRIKEYEWACIKEIIIDSLKSNLLSSNNWTKETKRD